MLCNDGRVNTVSEKLIVQAIFDEAGDTGTSQLSSRYMIVAGVVCGSLEPLRRVITRTRKGLGKKLRNIPELKARHSEAKITTHLLTQIVELDIEVCAAILDKRSTKTPDDTEEWYRRCYAEAVRLATIQHRQITVTMDNRYTKAVLRDKLTHYIVAHTQQTNAILSFVYADSLRERALQVADVVAWSFFQKYERGEAKFYELIKHKINGETLLVR